MLSGLARSMLLRFLSFRLHQRPLVLLDGRHRTVVSWAAKSACTHVVIWYLHRMGLLDEARAYHEWVHRYRREVLYSSQQYRNACFRLQLEGPSAWHYVKVVRDPVARCVSSYRHALRFGYEDKRISQVLRRPIDHRQGFSYETFIEYLERIDLRGCNVHHRLQAHPLDDSGFGRIWFIHADQQDLDTALSLIDKAQGVEPEGGAEERAKMITEAARRHAVPASERYNEDELWRKPLGKRDTGRWPGHQLRSSQPASAHVRKLYAADYEMIQTLSERAESLQARATD